MSKRSTRKKRFAQLALAAVVSVPAVTLLMEDTVEASTEIDDGFALVSSLKAGDQVIIGGVPFKYVTTTESGNHKLIYANNISTSPYGYDAVAGKTVTMNLTSGVGLHLNKTLNLGIPVNSLIVEELWDVGKSGSVEDNKLLAKVGLGTIPEFEKYGSLLFNINTMLANQSDLKLNTVYIVASGTRKAEKLATDILHVQPMIHIKKDSIFMKGSKTIVANIDPVVDTPILKQTLNMGDGDLLIDLAKHITDGNGEQLKYSIEDFGGATESTVDGGRYLRVKGKSSGETEVKVTGTDRLGKEVSLTFEVEVKGAPPNFKSVVSQVTKGSERLAVDVSYEDLSNSKLPLIVESTNPDIAKAVFNKVTKMIDTTALKKGFTKINYYVEGYPGVVKNFTLEVANSAPKVGTLVRQEAIIGVPKTITLPISDVDGETLDIFVPQNSGDKQYTVKQVGDKQLEITVFAKGMTSIPYTVTDSDGAFATGGVDMYVDNAAPIISSVNLPKVNFIDPYSQLTVEANFSEEDGEALTPRVEFNGQTYVGDINGTNVKIKGSELPDGLTSGPLTVIVSDPHEDSTPWNIKEVVVINVDNVSEYKALLAKHDENYENYSVAEHEVFFKTNKAVEAYLSNPTTSNYNLAMTKISELETNTIPNTELVNNWKESINLRATIIAVGKAEVDLTRASYTDATTLNNKLRNASNSGKFTDRLKELEKYLTVDEKLKPMESEVDRHKANPESLLSESTVNAMILGDMQLLVNFTKDTIQNDYRSQLQERYAIVKDHYFSSSEKVNSTDYADLFPAVETDPKLEGLYSELGSMFQPMVTNYPLMVEYADSLNNVLTNMDKESYDKYINLITSNGLTSVSPITKIVKDTYSYRNKFVDNPSAIKVIQDRINTLTDMDILKDKAGKVINSIGTVTNYNQVTLDNGVNADKLDEAKALVSTLADGQLKRDMNKYLNNSIPVIMLENDPYQFISDSELMVAGTVTDKNHSSTEVSVTLGGKTEKVQTEANRFSVVFDIPSIGYVQDQLVLQVTDSLTTKILTVKDLPIVITKHPKLYKELVKLLEEDRGESITKFDSVILNELLYVTNTYSALSDKTTQTTLDTMYGIVEKLSGKDEGLLEKRLKSTVKLNLNTIFDNYLDATEDDFNDIGLIDVDSSNIEELKSIISDYKANNDDTPTLADYESWLELIELYPALVDEYNSVYDVTESEVVEDTLADIDSEVNQFIPSWYDGLNTLRNKSKEMTKYKNAVRLTENAVKANTAKSIADAGKAIANVTDVKAKTRLEGLLEVANNLVVAEGAVKLAEESKYTVDYETANNLVSKLPSSRNKEKMKERLEYLDVYFEALVKVTEAELNPTDLTVSDALKSIEKLKAEDKPELLSRIESVEEILELQVNQANAQALIDKAKESLKESDYNLANASLANLPSGSARDKLVNELKEVFSQIQLVKKAEQAVIEAEDVKTKSSIDAAQKLVDTVAFYSKQQDLQDRLDSLAVYTNAENKVAKAESNISELNYNEAKDSVSELPAGDFKTSLNDRLDIVKSKLDEQVVEKSIETLINSIDGIPTQEKLDEIQSLINTLQDGSKKNAFLDSLAQKQKLVNDLTNLQNLVNGLQLNLTKDRLDEAIDSIKKLEGKLPNGNKQLKEIQKVINDLNNLAKVTGIVVIAEKSKDRVDYQAALTAVTNLPESKDKDALINRLDLLDKVINQEVLKSEVESKLANLTGVPTTEELVELKDLINSLDEGKVKENANATLADFEELVSQFESIEELVNKLDKNPNEYDLAKAITDLSVITGKVVEGDSKLYELQSKLDELAAVVDAITVVVVAEESKLKEDYDAALTIVNTLTQSAHKEFLTDRLELLDLEINQELIEGKLKEVLNKITGIPSQEDIIRIKDLISTLDDSPTKESYINTLANLEELVVELNRITDSVNKLESTTDRATLADITKDLTSLGERVTGDTSKLEELQSKLDELTNIINAKELVELAEVSNSKEDLITALDAVNKLKDSADKDSLADRLNKIDYSIMQESIKEVIDNKLNELTGIPAQEDIADLKDLINTLTDESLKDSYRKELVKLEELVTELTRITDLINNLQLDADKSVINKLNEDLAAVKDKVVGDKTELDELQSVLDKVVDIIDATDLVTLSETTKDEMDYSKALTAVDNLPESAHKDSLANRLEAVELNINKGLIEDKLNEEFSKVDGIPTKEQIDGLKELINTLDEGSTKDKYSNDLTKLEELLNELARLKDLLENLKANPNKSDAESLATELENIKDKVTGDTTVINNLIYELQEIKTLALVIDLVTLAETSKGEEDYNNAVDAVNKLPQSAHKDSLDERLDLIKPVPPVVEPPVTEPVEPPVTEPTKPVEPPVTEPEETITDEEFLNNLLNTEKATPQDLANFSGETIYNQMISKYITELNIIMGIEGEISKQDLVNVIRLVNGFEIAKRSIVKDHIAYYQEQLDNAHEAVKVLYPEAAVMFATNEYISNNNTVDGISEALAKLLDKDINDVKKDLLTILETDEVVTGNYVEMYVDSTTGEEIYSENKAGAFGLITISAQAPDGYILLDSEPVTINLTKEDNNQVVEILVTKDLTGTIPAEVIQEEVVPTEVIREEATSGDTASIDHRRLSNSIRIASLDLMFTSTTVVDNSQNDRHQYLYQVAQAGVTVMTAIETGDEAKIDLATNEVNKLLNGVYKSQLLALLGYTEGLEEVAVIDLTEVVPVVLTPEPETPPATVEPETPPTIAEPEPEIPPVVVEPEPETETPPTSGEHEAEVPPTEVEPETETPPTEVEQEKPITETPPTTVVPEANKPSTGGGGGSSSSSNNESNNNITQVTPPKDLAISDYVGKEYTGWTAGNHTSKVYDFKSETVNVALTLTNLLKETDVMKTYIKHSENGNHELVVEVNGKVVSGYKAKVILANEDKFKYLHLLKDGEAVAYPYTVKDGKFIFNVNAQGKVFNLSNNKVTFKDIAKYEVDKVKIEELASRLIIKGATKDKFKPGNKLTRAHYAALMSRALGYEETFGPSKFNDIQGQWYEGNVNAVAEKGLMSGVGGSKFAPNSNVTREQAINVLYRYLLIKEQEGLIVLPERDINNIKFNDRGKVQEGSLKAVAILAELGIVLGNQDGYLNPQDHLTRVQFVNLMHRTLSLTGDI